jgi:hypothetical protein
MSPSCCLAETARCHFGVTITPTILSSIKSTRVLACSSVVPLSISNPTVNDLRLDTVYRKAPAHLARAKPRVAAGLGWPLSTFDVAGDRVQIA